MSVSQGFGPGPVDPRLVFPQLRARSLEQALLEMAENLTAAGVVHDPLDLAERLGKRERDGCTGLGQGIAFPHCRVDALREVVLSVGVSAAGIDFKAPDGIPVTLLFLLLSPKEAPAVHLQALARLTRLVRTPGLPDELRHAGSGESIARALRKAEAAGPAAVTA
jgi:mannitol/fructose-specific phosphotransferase system IIA component (Ntr-type)